MNRIKQIKQRMKEIEKEMGDHRNHLKALKMDIVPNDRTNNSLLARNSIHRVQLKIVDLEVEQKELKKEAYTF